MFVSRIINRAISVFVALTIVFIGAATFAGAAVADDPDQRDIQIAVVGTTSGPFKRSGIATLQAMQILVDSVNKNNGVRGHKIELVSYDDKRDSVLGNKQAKEIGESNAVIAIGHSFSDTALSAGPIYKAAGIPIITASALNSDITINNEFYFRSSTDIASQSAIAVTYARRILGFDSAAVVYRNDSYGVPYGKEAVKYFNNSGGHVNGSYEYDGKNASAIADLIASHPAQQAIFLAMLDIDAKEVIVELRRHHIKSAIICTSSVAYDEFDDKFNDYPEEKAHKGYFVEGVYAVTPFIFDIANAETTEFASEYLKRFGDSPDWRAVKSFEAGQAALAALSAALAENIDPGDIKQMRLRIRDNLSGFGSLETAAHGITGPIFFDESRSRLEPMRLGKFESGIIIPTPTQLTPIIDRPYVNIDDELKAGNVVSFGKYFAWKQQVVYTGISLNKITRLDVSDSTFTADIYLWMLYSGSDDATRVEFPTLVRGTYNCDDPLLKDNYNGLKYRLYRIAGDFRNHFDFHRFPLDHQNLTIQFQNSHLTSSRIIYAVDRVGFAGSRIDRIDPQVVLEELGQWNFVGMQSYRDNHSTGSSLGNRHIAKSGVTLEYAGFRSVIDIKRETVHFLLKNLFPLGLLILVLYATTYFPSNFTLQRIGVSVTSMLSGMVLLLSMNNQMRDVGYVMSIEYMFYCFFFLSLSGIVVASLCETFRERELKDRAVLVEKSYRIIFPICVIFGCAVTWLSAVGLI